MTSFKSAPLVQLGSSPLNVTPICLGTMIFGEQVDEPTAFKIMDRAIERGINFFDTAEMYAVPPRPGTYNHTEIIIGNWLSQRPGVREKFLLATKVAGPARGMNWIREGSPDLTQQMMLDACDASLKRLKIDVIDLYQIHWPSRNVPAFGNLYYDPSKDMAVTSIHEQLQALGNRLHLAKVLRRGGNVLLLDEPTNDLDVETLRALEEALLDFPGCAVVISHDRWFLDRIATHILAFEGDSRVVWFEGNYAEYEIDRKRRLGAEADQPHRIKYKKLGG